MKTTDILRKQHNEIHGLIIKVKPILRERAFAEDILSNSTVLLNLTGKIIAHLSIEDTQFYPQVLRSDSETVKQTALRFQSEADEVRKELDTYRKAWKNTSLIQTNIPNLSVSQAKYAADVRHQICRCILILQMFDNEADAV